MRNLTIGLIGAAALAAGLLLIRQPREEDAALPRAKDTPAGESLPGTISLDRIRALGY